VVAQAPHHKLREPRQLLVLAGLTHREHHGDRLRQQAPRNERSVLSALGFTPRQRRLVIAAQATAIACVALVLGIPLGAIAGRVVWSMIAGSMGVATGAAFPLGLLAVGTPTVIVVLNLIGAIPARSAGRLRVADALRSE
jgi:ABC-type antimicrobial peptide transport system permease subunit